MFRAKVVRLLLTLLFLSSFFVISLSAGFPDLITDVEGSIIDLKELASKKRVVVITIKTASCQVCKNQLIRINGKLDELVACNVTFIVLSPGSVDNIKKVKFKDNWTIID